METLMLEKGESAIFGYGSLIFKEQVEVTLRREYAKKFIACTLLGWYRTWDVVMPNQLYYEVRPQGRFFPKNIIYLNITPARDKTLNGVLFVVRPEELSEFDRREWIYDRRRINRNIRGANILGGNVFTYVAKPNFLLPQGADQAFAAIRKSYLDIIEKGVSFWGAEFHKGYEASTQVVPRDLVIHDKSEGELSSPRPL